MSALGMRVAVWPGDGLVQRAGDTVVLVPGSASPEDAALDDLLARCRARAGSDLVAGLARAVLDEDSASVPAFAVVTADAEGVVVFCRGAVEVGAVAGGAAIRLSGADVVNWIERRLPAPVERLSAGPPGLAGAAVDRRCDLHAGVVTGGGVSLIALDQRHAAGSDLDEARSGGLPVTPAAMTSVGAVPTSTGGTPGSLPPLEETPAPSGPAEPEIPGLGADFEAIVLRAEPSRLVGREPLPVRAPDDFIPEPDHAEGAPPVALVPGVRCSRDHHNNPAALYCSSCGIKMGAHRTPVIVQGPRPPLGVFILDDGSTIPVQYDLLIGRDPSIDPAVIARTALPIRIEDDTNSVSRAHLLVIVDGWDVLVADNGSVNGTQVKLTADGEWRALGPSERIRIVTGSELHIGDRRLVFEQHHV